MAQHSTAQHSTPPITVAAAVSLRTVGRYVRNNRLGLVARWCTLRRATPWRDRGRRRYAQQSRVKQPWLACFVEGGGGAFNRFDGRGRRSKENCEIDAPQETRINNPNRSVARVLLAGCQFPLLLLEPGAENRGVRDTPGVWLTFAFSRVCLWPIVPCVLGRSEPSFSKRRCLRRATSIWGLPHSTTQQLHDSSQAANSNGTARWVATQHSIRLGTAAAEEPSFRQQRAMVVSLRRQ